MTWTCMFFILLAVTSALAKDVALNGIVLVCIYLYRRLVVQSLPGFMPNYMQQCLLGQLLGRVLPQDQYISLQYIFSLL